MAVIVTYLGTWAGPSEIKKKRKRKRKENMENQCKLVLFKFGKKRFSIVQGKNYLIFHDVPHLNLPWKRSK